MEPAKIQSAPFPQRLRQKLSRFLISTVSLIAGITLAVLAQAVLGSVFDNLLRR